jgi:2'-5' RNA ligase
LSNEQELMIDYALWLVPASPERDTTTKCIEDLIKAEAGSPAFEPHITLLHPISKSIPLESITTTLQNIAQELDLRAKPLWLDLKPAQAGTFYYQSVLAPVVIKSNDTLSSLRSACEEAFDLKNEKTYFPHLSLLYGD